jgi:hypothetical protein
LKVPPPHLANRNRRWLTFEVFAGPKITLGGTSLYTIARVDHPSGRGVTTLLFGQNSGNVGQPGGDIVLDAVRSMRCAGWRLG